VQHIISIRICTEADEEKGGYYTEGSFELGRIFGYEYDSKEPATCFALGRTADAVYHLIQFELEFRKALFNTDMKGYCCFNAEKGHYFHSKKCCRPEVTWFIKH
jgi:hypothetical protein